MAIHALFPKGTTHCDMANFYIFLGTHVVALQELESSLEDMLACFWTIFPIMWYVKQIDQASFLKKETPSFS